MSRGLIVAGRPSGSQRRYHRRAQEASRRASTADRTLHAEPIAGSRCSLLLTSSMHY